jgi:predicted nucleic acid-binding protein
LKRIAIQDANILIDLINCGLLEHVLSLDFTFFTTSIIRAELATHQDSVLEFYVEKGLFEVISISSEEFTMILEITSKYSKLSSQDCSALFYSEKLDALLLTGDKALRNVAELLKINVRGIFWLLDQLVDNNIVTESEGCKFLKNLMKTNKRLPIEECNKRLRKWCEDRLI